MRKNSNIIRAFDALTIVKGINSLGGPDKQVYYIESDVYAPDRRITPLLLQPYVNVSDPNGIITAGDKVSELVDGAWYVDAIDPKNRVTKSSAGSTLDDPFTIGDNHRLMVRLNTDKSVMLFFEGDYYDSRKGSKIHISLSYMLSTTHNSQNKPAPKVLLSKGASYTYNPLDDLTELIIESQLADDGKLLRGAVEWCEVEGTKITAISDAMPYYISGQHSDKLKINPSLMGDVVIRARNVSEEIYNKVYGINPEWDNKMQEVFENRNLIFSKTFEAGYYDTKNGDADGSAWHYRTEFNKPVIIDEKSKYTAQGKERMLVLFYKSDNTYISSIDIKEPPMVLTPPAHAALVRMYFLQPTSSLPPVDDIVNEFKFKLEKGDKATPYTPAPEDLSYRNLIANGDFRNGVKGWVYNYQINPTSNNGWLTTEIKSLTSSSRVDCVIKPTEDLLYMFFWAKVDFNSNIYTTLSPSSDAPRTPTIKGEPTFTSSVIYGELRDRAYFYVPTSNALVGDKVGYAKCTAINLTETFGKGNEPTKEQLDEVFKDMPYIPSPYDYAPDGIVKGTYQSDMKFTPLYPNIEANVVYLTTPVIKKGVERIKAQAMLSTNKKKITNPEKHFDLKWILKPATAGGSETVVGTGEFVDIPVANLPEGRVIGLDLDYNFKKQ